MVSKCGDSLKKKNNILLQGAKPEYSIFNGFNYITALLVFFLSIHSSYFSFVSSQLTRGSSYSLFILLCSALKIPVGNILFIRAIWRVVKWVFISFSFWKTHLVKAKGVSLLFFCAPALILLVETPRLRTGKRDDFRIRARKSCRVKHFCLWAAVITK